jgi:hypothetical protein
MSQLTGARLTGTFVTGGTYGDPPAETTIQFKITGFTVNIDERPQIDLTSGTDTTMHAVPGRRGITTATVNARFDTAQFATLEAELRECVVGLLTIQAAGTTDCTNGIVYTDSAWLQGFSVEASMDTAVDATLTFLVDVAEPS